MSSKKLWRGKFVFHCEMERNLYAYAYTKRQAWLTFCRRLAKKHDVGLVTVMGLFDGSRNNFEITEEPISQIGGGET